MDEDFFCSNEFNDKKSGIPLSNAKKLSHNIVDIEMDKAKYFQSVSNVILNKDNSYRNKARLSIQNDKAPTFDRRKSLFYANANEKNKNEINNSKINFAFQSNEFTDKTQF